VAGHYAAAIMGAAGVVFLLAPALIVGLFTDDPEVLRFGAMNLRAVAFGFLFFAYGFVMTQAFNGAGDTATPMWLNAVCFWLFQIPAAWVLAEVLDLGPLGVFIAGSASYAVMAMAAVALFRRGRWKQKRI
jgi:Na+-driven multidrug efflux pump